MHELSIAQSLIELVEEQLVHEQQLVHEHDVQVKSLRVRVGRLSGVLPQALMSAFLVARQGTLVSRATLEIDDVAPTIWCGQCDREQPAKSVQALVCGQCASPGERVIAGRELELLSIEVVDAGEVSQTAPNS